MEEQNRIRFFREAEVIAQLYHPHIVRLSEVNQQAHFLVMEYIPGERLHAWKQQQGLSHRAASVLFGPDFRMRFTLFINVSSIAI